MYYIYELVDPTTSEVGYVGITINPEARLLQHLTSEQTNPAKNEWIQSLKSQNLSIRMNIIEIVEDIKAAREREKHWIKAYISDGVSLYNTQHALRPSKKALGTSTPRPILRSYQLLSKRTAAEKYQWADYPSELLCDPEYLDDAFADYIDEMQEMDNRVFSEEEIRCELDIHTLSRFISPTSDKEEGYISAWYLKHFEKSGRFEGDKPTLKFH